MKPLARLGRIATLAAIVGAAVLRVQAQSGTFVAITNGNWSEATNWLSSTIANGAGNTATFSNELATGVEVNLDSPRTIGNLIFDFTGFTITNNGADAANILTLQGPAKPVISIPFGSAATIRRTVMAGTNGYVLDGGGTLNLLKANSDSNNVISGGIVISNGSTIQIQGVNDGNDSLANTLALAGAGPITFVNGTLNIQPGANTSPSYGVVNSDLIVPADGTATIILPVRFAGAADNNAAAIGQGLGGALTGSGTLNVVTRYVRGNIVGDWSAFTGLINVTPGSGSAIDQDFRLGNPAGLPNASVDLGGASYLVFRYFRQLTNVTVFPVGLLSGQNAQAFVSGSESAGQTLIYRIGAKLANAADMATLAASLVNGAGPLALIKEGAGTWILTGTNTYTGFTTISNGVLQIGDGFSESGSLGSGPITNLARLVISRGGSLTVPGAISGNGSLTNSGFGSIISLTGSNTYSGPTFVTAGKLVLGTVSSLSGSVSVIDGASLGALVSSAGTTLRIGGLTFGASCTLDVECGILGTPTSPVITNTGAVSLNGDVTVNVAGTNFAAGTVTLLQYSSRSGAGSFVMGPLPPGILAATLNDDTANRRVTLSITSVSTPPDATLRWIGSAAGDWDIGNVANAVWREVRSGIVTNYTDGSPVRFDDTATGTPNINVTTLVSPALVTVSNASLTYKLGGAGWVTGIGGLTKQGPGKLTITTPNDNSGPTLLEGGTLELGDNVAQGTLGGGPITNQGTLRLNNPIPFTLTNLITGSGTILQVGAGPATVSGANSHTGGIQVNADAQAVLTSGTAAGSGGTVRLNGGVLTIANVNIPAGNPVIVLTNSVLGSMTGNRQVDSPISGTNVMLTFSNNTLLTLNGSLAGFSGTILLGTPNSQLLRFNSGGANNCFGSSNAYFIVPAGTSLQNRNGGTIDIGALDGAGTLGGPQNANNALVNFSIGALGSNTVFSGTIDNGPLANNRLTGFTKVGTGSLTLENANLPYYGPTVISNGVLALVGSGSPTNSTNFTVVGSAVLDVSGLATGNPGTIYLGQGARVQTLRGDGTVRGSVVLGANGILSPGFSVGVLNVTNVATLGGTNVMEFNLTNSPNSDRLVAASIVYGGTLVLTNVGPDVTGTNTLQLFSGAISGGFANVITQALNNVSYDLSQLNVNGSIRLIGPAGGPPTTPPTMGFTLSGGSLDLTWPPGHTGWQLQMQTNNLTQGVSTNPADWSPVANSTTTNRVSVPVDSARTAEFYRLVLPQ